VDPLQSDSSVQTLGAYYTVQAPKPWDLSWRCAGYDCYSGIAEEFYQCTSKGLPNDVPNTANRLELQNKCWWPIFAYNELKYINQIPLQYKTQPWNFLQVGWLLYIPGAIDRKPPVPKPPILPELPNGFEGLPGTTPQNPWNGYNGATSAYPRVTFDRYIAWDGSYKTDQIKWSETDRPVAPTITAMQTNESATAVTVYGVGIPKNHPLEVRVWNEYRYCWGCGSGWEFASRLATAQHVKIVLFTDKWQYLGEVWNDSPDGKWQITLPLGGSIQPGSRIFAEVQIQADYSFILHWWADTYETAKFDLRDSKYTGYPYFASGAGNIFTVPEARMTDLAEWAFRYREILSGNYQIVSGKHQFCGVWIKDYAYLTYRGDTWQTYTNLIFNPQLNWAFRLRGDIRLKYWDSYGGVCGNLGLPVTDDLIASPSPLGTQGAYQQFEHGSIYSSSYGTYATIGKMDELHNAGGGTAGYGFPKGDAVEQNGRLFQEFEGGSISMCGGADRNK
ncbi:hypothetical protein KC640_02055, partial [Candidatus Dojkabacteria bacterium]|nr:hypothetical protein [Candidatus Dojkabacteria bacterium]